VQLRSRNKVAAMLPRLASIKPLSIRLGQYAAIPWELR
jgi:hypothetical protein